MKRWNLYALDLYVLVITTSNFSAYQIANGIKITRFIPSSKNQIDVEKIVPGLLFKCEDVFDVENRYELNPLNTDDGEPTEANATNDRKTISPEIEKMINDAGPEVEKLYEPIKRIGFSGRKQGTNKQYRDAALEFFRENRKEFTIIIESYLYDWSLYTFRERHEKEGFIGKLLQKIANDLDLDIDNYQELYTIYKSTKRLKK